jgi:hypothetical protein
MARVERHRSAKVAGAGLRSAGGRAIAAVPGCAPDGSLAVTRNQTQGDSPACCRRTAAGRSTGSSRGHRRPTRHPRGALPVTGDAGEGLAAATRPGCGATGRRPQGCRSVRRSRLGRVGWSHARAGVLATSAFAVAAAKLGRPALARFTPPSDHPAMQPPPGSGDSSTYIQPREPFSTLACKLAPHELGGREHQVAQVARLASDSGQRPIVHP